VIITSNNERELPDAFLRRCVFHFIDFPDGELMRGSSVSITRASMRLWWIRRWPLFTSCESYKDPEKTSTSELIDWIAALKAAGVADVRLDAPPFLGALLKKEQDHAAFAERPRPGNTRP